MRLFIFAFALTLPFAAMAEAPRYFRTLSPVAIRIDPERLVTWDYTERMRGST